MKKNRRCFYQLDGEGIRYEIAAFAKAVEAGQASANINVRPWDRDGTCSDEVRTIFKEAYPSPYYFVGGRSFEAGPAGNDLCILCGVSKEKNTDSNMKILRLHFGDAQSVANRDFNILLAPVSNPLNGGPLENVKEEK